MPVSLFFCFFWYILTTLTTNPPPIHYFFTAAAVNAPLLLFLLSTNELLRWWNRKSMIIFHYPIEHTHTFPFSALNLGLRIIFSFLVVVPMFTKRQFLRFTTSLNERGRGKALFFSFFSCH